MQRRYTTEEADQASGREAGFTLVEMLVVITIIGLVMALVGPRVLNYLGESKVKAARIQIESFSSALDLYYLDNGRYPTASEGLGALVQRPGNATAWNGPYFKTRRSRPIPGARLVYRARADTRPTKSFRSARRAGPDGRCRDQERDARAAVRARASP